MMAALWILLRPKPYCLAHTANLELPRLTQYVGGAEKGGLSREVTKLRRSRRFFFEPSERELAPSTSAADLARLRFRLSS